MRRSLGLILALVVGAATLYLVGCGDDKKSCSDVDAVCGEVTTCCTSNSCYYEANGQRYDCDGTDCLAAAAALAEGQCASGKPASNESSSSTQQEALAEVERLLDADKKCPTCP